MIPKTRITEIAEECAYMLGKKAVNGAGRYLQDKAVGLIETALNAAADDERARVVALIEAEIDRWTELSGQGSDGEVREQYGLNADAVCALLHKVQA
jgi:hypothetical protein